MSLPACGGTLVAPDRIVTAAHCVNGRQIAAFDQLWIGGAYHPAKHYALAPDWRKRNGGNSLDGERFDAARMICAIDIDGVAPLSSGCNGDSGGPLLSGSQAAPVLRGIVS
jgi:secreted trypsin-like serine protease